MPDFAAPLFDMARGASNTVRQLLSLPPAMPIDYPFADSDVAQLQRVTASPDSFALDDQTWDDVMLAPWLASVSGEVSIVGRQELYRRLRAGLGEEARTALIGKPCPQPGSAGPGHCRWRWCCRSLR